MTEPPRRVQLSRRKGWRMPPNTVKVDRSTIFGNPFAVSKGTMSGGAERWVNMPRYFIGDSGEHFPTKPEAMAASVNRFRAWINHPANRRLRETCIVGLRGKNLGCWCPLDKPCHADVLLELANGE